VLGKKAHCSKKRNSEHKTHPIIIKDFKTFPLNIEKSGRWLRLSDDKTK
jgi:hypothetical protein